LVSGIRQADLDTGRIVRPVGGRGCYLVPFDASPSLAVTMDRKAWSFAEASPSESLILKPDIPCCGG